MEKKDINECTETMNRIDEQRTREINKRIKKENLIPVEMDCDIITAVNREITTWWKKNNMTPEKYKKSMLEIINKYAEQGEKNE